MAAALQSYIAHGRARPPTRNTLRSFRADGWLSRSELIPEGEGCSANMKLDNAGALRRPQ